MEIDNDKGLVITAVELRRQAEERLRAKTTERHPPLTKEATRRAASSPAGVGVIAGYLFRTL
jgi:hypothetical protein